MSPSFMRRNNNPLVYKPMHGKRFLPYFNLDNGGGKIRGIYAENNAIKAIFDSWLAPFHDLGAKTTTKENRFD